MPTYAYGCTCGSHVLETRAIAERSLERACPDCGGPLSRDFAAEVGTITINQSPLNFFTQWGDVYDVSPREMARRQDIERYNPSLGHKPEIPRTRFNLPRGVDDIDTLIKTIAPVDGQRETDKLTRRVAPLPEERAYT